MNNIKPIMTIYDCLSLMGSENPFTKSDTLTKSGYLAFDELKELIGYLNENGVVQGLNEDKLDELVNQKGY